MQNQNIPEYLWCLVFQSIDDKLVEAVIGMFDDLLVD